jgi:hypothetical protein
MKRILTLVLAGALASCGASKKAAETPTYPPAPSWVSGKPIESGYYAGIGMARKDAPGDFMQAAKNNALNDLASEISVEIKSNSMFNQIEAGDEYKSNFQNTTRLKSREDLEGYDLAGTWEDANSYWVYYRLNKMDHEAAKARKRNQAREKARQLHEAANAESSQGQGLQAIKTRLQAFGIIAPYINEAMPYETAGGSGDLSLDIYRGLTRDLQSLTLAPVKRELTTVRGGVTQPDDFAFSATFHGQPAAGIPVIFSFSEGRIPRPTAKTGLDGTVQYAFGKMTQRGPMASFKAEVDIPRLLEENTADDNLKLLLGRVVPPKAEIKITIASPKIFIRATENNFGQSGKSKSLQQALEFNLTNEQLRLVKAESQADLVFVLRTDTRQGPENNGFFTTYLNGTIEVYDGEGKLLATSTWRDIRGVQSSYELAANDAYQRAVEEFNKSMFRDLRRKLFE